ncbi:MAG: ATP-binding protein [Coprothermobacterota bacterium]|nr:ATP-binding protein [Coprothermobacterota bacterium]
MFVGRTQELKAMRHLHQRGQPELLILYGKRRVGKTALIREFIGHSPQAMYFLAQRRTERETLRALARATGELWEDPLLEKTGYPSWPDFFDRIHRQYQIRPWETPWILAIDEFPYLAESSPGVSSFFQAGWDQILSQLPVFLILCGSSMARMESETLAYKAPLYGRRTAQILLEPLTFLEARQFFPDASFAKAMEFISAAGGTPGYLSRLAPYADLHQALQAEVFSPETMLFREGEFLLVEELREPRTYFSILQAIAHHCHKLSEIINETGLAKSALHVYLHTLESLRLIAREVPATEKWPDRSRQGRYTLADPFLEFWFQFVFPFTSSLTLGNTRPAFAAFNQGFPTLVAKQYERLAREWVLAHQDAAFSVDRIGRWWDRNEEIDVVAVNEAENRILFGEVKWTERRVGSGLLEELKRKATLVSWGQPGRQETYCLFSKSGFIPALEERAQREGVLLVAEDRLALRG